MSIFKKRNIAGARANGNHTYLKPGRYLAQLAACKEVERRNKEDAYVNEFVIKAVLQKYEDDEGNALATNPVNTTASHLLGPENDYFDGDIKAMWMGILGWDEAQASDEDEGINLEFLEGIVGPDQPMCGVVVELDCTQIITAKGNLFTRITYVRSNFEDHPSVITDEELAEAGVSL